MKLKCEVQVSNRYLPTLNIRKHGRPAFTFVSLGRKPGHYKDGKIYLLLCTAQNRNGTHYLLTNNVEQIFSKFICEGKATIRLSSPADDISFSKADPNHLSILIKMVKLASEGKPFPENVLSSLTPASAKQIEKPSSSLHITSPSQYPMSFPKSLLELTVNNCLLKRVSPMITALTNLSVLDLSNNMLPHLPESFSQLVVLHTLNLSHNKLTVLPPVLYKSDIRKSLMYLDLKHNEIQCLPRDMTQFLKLHSLNLGKNQIKHLPESTSFIKSLQNLFLPDNLLEYLPATLLSKFFDTMDFSNNKFVISQAATDRSAIFPFPTLVELAARTIISHSVSYTSEDLDVHSVCYLNQAHFCICGQPCFESKVCRFIQGKLQCRTNYGNDYIPFNAYLCSKKCLQRFDKI
ncbi:leucine-rich repeat protein 1 [Biomphalaria glabrata]|nr:leucine-rich repeat protein 1-like [Biomphalaria glabrata]